MAPTQPAPREKVEYANLILRKWKKLRAFVRSPAACNALVDRWMYKGNNTKARRKHRGKMRANLRKPWPDMPSNRQPQYEGLLSWRPNRAEKGEEKAEPTLEELKDTSIKNVAEWPGKVDRDKVLWNDYNAAALSDSPGPLLEMIWSRATASPSDFFYSDRNAGLGNFTGYYLPPDVPPQDTSDWVTIEGDKQGGSGVYGDIHQSDDIEERTGLWEAGLEARPVTELGMEVQAKIYQFLVRMCEVGVGTVQFNEAIKASEDVAADEPMPDIEDERTWRLEPPDGDAPDEDARLDEYLLECKRLLPYKHPEEVRWEFLKRLADLRRMQASRVLLGMREDPAKFQEVMEEMGDRQGMDQMFTSYYRWVQDTRTGAEKWEAVSEFGKEEYKFREADMKLREAQVVRDVVLTAVHRYEIWSHVFRLTVVMQGRWSDYQAHWDRDKHIHEDLQRNFWLLHRLLESAEFELGERNNKLGWQLAAPPRFQNYFDRFVSVEKDGTLQEFDYLLAEVEDGDKFGGEKDEPTQMKNRNMVARMHALWPLFGSFHETTKVVAEDILAYSKEKGVGIMPLTQQFAEDVIAKGYTHGEFDRCAMFYDTYNEISRGYNDDKYDGRASEVLGKILDLKTLRYNGHEFKSGPWFPLVDKMMTAITFGQHLPPDEAVPLSSVVEEEEEGDEEPQKEPTPEPPPSPPKPQVPSPPSSSQEPPPPQPQPAPEPEPEPEPEQPAPPQQLQQQQQQQGRRRRPTPPTYAQREVRERGRPAPAAQPPVERAGPSVVQKKHKRTRDVEADPVVIGNKRVWDTLELVMKPDISANERSSKVTWNEISRMLNHIGYEDVQNDGSAVRFVPGAALRARDFTTALVKDKPHGGAASRYSVSQARWWVLHPAHGLPAKGWTFACFQYVPGGGNGGIVDM